MDALLFVDIRHRYSLRRHAQLRRRPDVVLQPQNAVR